LAAGDALVAADKAPMPKEAIESGMKNGNLAGRRHVVAPPGPGINVDRDRLVTADIHVHSKRDIQVRALKTAWHHGL
jgi:hypothetical protein